MTGEEDFIEAIGGQKVGQVEGNRWTCQCGSSGIAADGQTASVELYFHRRAGCGPMVVVVLDDTP